MIAQLQKWLRGNGHSRRSDRCVYKKMVRLKSGKYVVVVTATERRVGRRAAPPATPPHYRLEDDDQCAAASTSRDEAEAVELCDCDLKHDDDVVEEEEKSEADHGSQAATSASVGVMVPLSVPETRSAGGGGGSPPTTADTVTYEVPTSAMAVVTTSDRSCPTDDYDKYGKGKTGFSSLTTVLSVGGFLIVGLTLIASAVIVFCTQRHMAFTIVAAVFIACGVFFLALCAMLQKKNITMLLAELKAQLGFFLSSRPPKATNSDQNMVTTVATVNNAGTAPTVHSANSVPVHSWHNANAPWSRTLVNSR